MITHQLTALLRLCEHLHSFKNYQECPYEVEIPKSLELLLHKSQNTIPCIKADSSQPLAISKCYMLPLSMDRLYIALIDNLTEPIVDFYNEIEDNTILINRNHIYVMFPSVLFKELLDDAKYNADDIAYLFIHVYFNLLKFDIYMHHDPNILLLKYCNSDKVQIPLYDIEAMICALCCVYIATWNICGPDNGEILDPICVTNAFTDKELPHSIKEKVWKIMRKAQNVSALVNMINSGEILEGLFD